MGPAGIYQYIAQNGTPEEQAGAARQAQIADDATKNAFANMAAARQANWVSGQRGTLNFLSQIGGGGPGYGDRLADVSIENARNNAASQVASMNNYGPGAGAAGGAGGSPAYLRQTMYSATGHGAMGAPVDLSLRDPGGYYDPYQQSNRDAIAQRMGAVGGMPNYQMAGNTAAGVNIDQAQQAQFRNQQLALGNALMAQANGQGPSVAGSQLRQSTEMNLQAALAQAASNRGGNLGAAQYQLGNARANIQQQAAQQLAQTRIQEQMAARAQLGDVLNAGRGADIGLATNQAQLAQQNNQFNAGQLNQVGQSNMNANIQQDQYRQSTLNQLLAMGMSYDQAAATADLQARQFGADLFNRTTLGINGQNMQGVAQDIQLATGGIGAAGSMFSGISNMAGNSGGGGGGANGNFTANGAMGPMTISGISK